MRAVLGGVISLIGGIIVWEYQQIRKTRRQSKEETEKWEEEVVSKLADIENKLDIFANNKELKPGEFAKELEEYSTKIHSLYMRAPDDVSKEGLDRLEEFSDSLAVSANYLKVFNEEDPFEELIQYIKQTNSMPEEKMFEEEDMSNFIFVINKMKKETEDEKQAQAFYEKYMRKNIPNINKNHIRYVSEELFTEEVRFDDYER